MQAHLLGFAISLSTSSVQDHRFIVAQKLTDSRTLSLKSKAKSRSKRAHLKFTEYDRQDKMVETNRARSLLALGSIGELGNGLKMPACVSRNDLVGELTS